MSTDQNNSPLGNTKDLSQLAQQLGEALKEKQYYLVTAESCTGGWVAKSITDIAGSSHWFDRGFITYTNKSKQEMLGVSKQTLDTFGAVSEKTVSEMVQGAIERSNANLGVAISGIAGPGGGSPEKPVGMVCFAWGGVNMNTHTGTENFNGDREQVRAQAVAAALRGLLNAVK